MTRRITRRFWCALALLLLVVITRLPLLAMRQPVDDEVTYAVVAQQILAGGHPYLDAVERKPPFLFWTYAAVLKSAGSSNWMALHAVSVAWVLLTMAGLYVAARSIFDEETGLVAALLYGVYQPWGYWQNLAFNGEVLMNLPLAWSWAIVVGRDGTSTRRLAAAGALVAAGTLLKQPAAVTLVPLVAYAAWRSASAAEPRAAIRTAAAAIGGFAAVVAMAGVVLALQHVLADAFYWSVRDHDIPHVFWSKGFEHTAAFAAICGPLVLAAVAAARWPAVFARRRPERRALLVWVAAALVGVSASGRFFPHYYIQLVPPLALLAAPAMVCAWRSLRAAGPRRLYRAGLVVWIAATTVLFGAAHVRGLSHIPATSSAGAYLRARSVPSDRIFVWGQAPRIYLDAARRPASRYIATFPLTGYIFGPAVDVDTRGRVLPGAWNNLDGDLQRHPPAFIVDTEVGPNARYPMRDFPRLERLVAARYEVRARLADAAIYRLVAPKPGRKPLHGATFTLPASH